MRSRTTFLFSPFYLCFLLEGFGGGDCGYHSHSDNVNEQRKFEGHLIDLCNALFSPFFLFERGGGFSK